VLQRAIGTVILAALAFAANADAPWSRARSAHFEVFIERPADDASALARRLEELRSVLVQVFPARLPEPEPPTTIVAFANERSFGAVVPLYRGRRQDVDGFFHTDSDRGYIAVNLGAGRQRPHETAFHEYVHVYLGETLASAPAWMAEGLAELVSDLDIATGDAVFGRARPEHVRELSTYGWLPLDTLLKVGYLSPMYNEGDRRGQFYAQSWALVRRLLLREDDGWPRLRAYTDAVAAGEEPAAAFARCFNLDLPSAAAELARSLDGSAAEGLRRRIDVGSAPMPVAAAAPTAEVQQVLGTLLALDVRPREAKPYFDRALAADPDYAPAHQALARQWLDQGRLAEAKKHLEAARRRDPDDPRVLFSQARTLLRESADRDSVPSEEATADAVAALERAVARAPLYADAAELLARLQPRPLDARIALLQRIFAANPGRSDVGLTLSWLHLKTDDLQRAAAVLTRARESARDDDQRFLCDLQLRRIAAARTITAEVEGQLVSLACLPGGALEFVVESGDRRLRLRAPTAASVLLYGADGERVEKTFTCGSQRAAVKAWYKRAPAQEAQAADGVLLSLVFR
jgi:tetratricopeptide (TPR) repeat protein